MLLSVIIATYNRSKDVKKVIDELKHQYGHLVIDFPNAKLEEEIELILVDNNSTDDTGAMAFQILSEQSRKKGKEKYPEEQYLELKYFLETQQGSSQARNRGIKEASGNLLAFLDDDIHLDQSWLKNSYNLAKEKPENFCNGARVIPIWELDPLPEWLSIEAPYEVIQSCFPAHDHGEEKKSYPFDFPNSDRKIQNPISACFLASKDVFENHGDFRLDLGIKANERGACEDTEFFWRLIKAGVELEYNPEITVYHPIVKEKITKDFVLRWYRLLGKTLEYMKDKKLTHLNPSVQVSPRLVLLTKLLVFSLTEFMTFAFLNPQKAFWFQCQREYVKGQMDYKMLRA